MKTESTSETLYPAESGASESLKLVRLARSLKSQWISNPRAEINVYGYIEAAAAYSSAKEKEQRTHMHRRFDGLRDTLSRMGVGGDAVWLGGVAFSSNRGGQIDLFIRDGKGNILPPYPSYVSPSSPKQASSAKESWSAENKATVNQDAELEAEVELSYEDSSGSRQDVPSVTVQFKASPGGKLLEVGGGLRLLKRKLAEGLPKGTVDDVEIEVTVTGLAEFDRKRAGRLAAEVKAKITTALSANVTIPGIKGKIPVELSFDFDAVAAEAELGASLTVIKF